jgi:hypothetical protein
MDQRAAATEQQKLGRHLDGDVCAAGHAAFGRAGWSERERCARLMARLAQPPPQGVAVEQVVAIARSGLADDALLRAACPKAAACKRALCAWVLAARERVDAALHERRVEQAAKAVAPGKAMGTKRAAPAAASAAPPAPAALAPSPPAPRMPRAALLATPPSVLQAAIVTPLPAPPVRSASVPAVPTQPASMDTESTSAAAALPAEPRATFPPQACQGWNAPRSAVCGGPIVRSTLVLNHHPWALMPNHHLLSLLPNHRTWAPCTVYRSATSSAPRPSPSPTYAITLVPPGTPIAVPQLAEKLGEQAWDGAERIIDILVQGGLARLQGEGDDETVAFVMMPDPAHV